MALNLGETPHDINNIQDFWYALREVTNGDNLGPIQTITPGDDPSSIERYATQFNDLNVVQRTDFINLNSSKGLSDLRDVTEETNGGSVAANSATGEIKLSTGAQTNSVAGLETARWGQYSPGYEAEAGMGMRLPQQPSGDGDIKWGYFDGQNGYYFGYDSEGLYVGQLRDGSENKKVYRENWNGRNLDDVNGVDFQPNDGAIFQIDYAWYGYGSIQFTIISSRENNPQRNIIVHTFATDDETSITNPNQPVQVKIENNGSSNAIDAYVGGRQYSILGDPVDDFRISSQTVNDVSVDNGSWTHIASIKRKSSDDRRVNMLIDGFDVNTDDDTKFALTVNADIGSTNYGSFDLIPASETIAEVSSSGTFNGIGAGTKRFSTFIPVGQNSKSESGDPIRELNQPIPRQQPLSLIAQGVGTAVSVDATLRVREQW